MSTVLWESPVKKHLTSILKLCIIRAVFGQKG